MLALTFALAMTALPPDAQSQMVTEARKILGVPYELGGRMRKKGERTEGVDCQGLVFFALQSISKCGWKSWSVMPTTSVKGELGLPVDGLNPVKSADIDLTLLVPGDILWFVDPIQNPAEPSIAKLDGVDVWVWHAAMYSGHGKFIVGDHFAGKVVEEELIPYAKLHFTGLFVSRMKDGPAASTCKQHRPMNKP